MKRIKSIRDVRIAESLRDVTLHAYLQFHRSSKGVSQFLLRHKGDILNFNTFAAQQEIVDMLFGTRDGDHSLDAVVGAGIEMFQFYSQVVRDLLRQIVQQLRPHRLLYYVLARTIAVRVSLVMPASRLGRVQQVGL